MSDCGIQGGGIEVRILGQLAFRVVEVWWLCARWMRTIASLRKEKFPLR